VANRNLRIVRKVASDMGATIQRIDDGAKHAVVHLRTDDGRCVRMQLSRHNVDPYILGGWVRQALTRPNRFYISSLMEGCQFTADGKEIV